MDLPSASSVWGAGPFDRGCDDALDQRGVGDALHPGHDDKVRILGMQPRQRVDFEEVHSPLAVTAKVDPSAVATAESLPDGQRHLGRRRGHHIIGQPVANPGLVALLVGEGVNLGLCLLLENDFRRAQRCRIASGAEDSHGEFATREKRLDKHGLTESLEQLPERSSVRFQTFDVLEMPLLVPSATGFMNKGNG